MYFRQVRASLADLLGADRLEAVVQAAATLQGRSEDSLRGIACGKVDFFPRRMQAVLSALLPAVGKRLIPAVRRTPRGAPNAAFGAAANLALSPVAGWGFYRLGEDGRLRFVSKAEHYHALLGHGFPGYGLIDRARRLGIPNPTHNNTRGFITRRVEEELVRTANGLLPGDRTGLDRALTSRRCGALNRVLNLQTGSLACEAGLKMMLARFYRPEAASPKPKYEGRIPVFVVFGDDEGGLQANYHGTSVLGQVLRGMWPTFADRLDRRGLFRIASVRPNNMRDLERVFGKFDRGRAKIAGFCHELVMMNYGAKRIEHEFIHRAYELCRNHDVPTMADEIQSCLWCPELYMFREYGLRPTMAVIGKGYTGGEYAASRIVFDASIDCLPLFGALITSGQEELSSLAYLITLRWAEENRQVTGAIGEAYEAALKGLVRKYPGVLAGFEGRRHLAALHFRDLGGAQAFVKRLVADGLDISVQSYKASCPPAALTKLPLIVGMDAVEMIAKKMDRALRRL